MKTVLKWTGLPAAWPVLAKQQRKLVRHLGTRPVKVACRKDFEAEWYYESVTITEWKGMCRVFDGEEKALYMIMDSVSDSYLEPEYRKEHLSNLYGEQHRPDYSDAIDPDDLEDMDSDLEDALDDMAGDPLDMMKAMLDPEDFLQEFERKMQPFTQDAAELDPAELWKGFGI